MNDQTIGNISFIQNLHDAKIGGKQSGTTQMDTPDPNPKMEQQISEVETPYLMCQVLGDKLDGNVQNRSDLFSMVMDKVENCDFDHDEIPPSQDVRDKYLVAIQVRKQDTQETDMEIFWTTPDQTVGDWIMGRVTMEGSNIQFDAPRIGSKIVSLHERLDQLGDICNFHAKKPKGMLRDLLF